MTTPLWCLLIAIFIPYALAASSGYFKKQQLGSLDIKEPRVQAAALSGAGGRAVAAQENMWEALVVFTAAVLVNHVKGDADPDSSALAAQIFIVARIAHGGAYIANIAPLRSLSFLVGLVCCIRLFFV